MTAQSADHYRACMERNAQAMYPDSPAEFRETWSTCTVDWMRAASQLLSADQICTLSQALRSALVTGKADLTEIWQLAALQAGVL